MRAPILSADNLLHFPQLARSIARHAALVPAHGLVFAYRCSGRVVEPRAALSIE